MKSDQMTTSLLVTFPLPDATTQEMETDSTLVAASLEGDGAAFARLVERYRPRVRAVAFAILGEREEAEDVAQEALLRAYLGLATLRHPDRFASWITAVAANLARMRLRRPRVETLPLDRLADGQTDRPEGTGRELRGALETLTPATRAMLAMHYVHGLSCAEIADLLGTTSGAVRVRLHRARNQLRTLLIPTREETKMIETVLEDVYVRVAPGEERLADERLRIVVLREREGGRRLPIWIGPAEGDALTLRLRDESFARPLTPDLTASLLEAVGARVERIVVTRLEDKTFYSLVAVSAAGDTREVDARPSDALNLATRTGAPIFVDEAVLDAAGIVAEDIPSVLERELEIRSEHDVPPGEWRPNTLALVTSFWPGR
jgi:RNA polymerase sigma factor (sigma-70 family)